VFFAGCPAPDTLAFSDLPNWNSSFRFGGTAICAGLLQHAVLMPRLAFH
jgi:hypothetical protein